MLSTKLVVAAHSGQCEYQKIHFNLTPNQLMMELKRLRNNYTIVQEIPYSASWLKIEIEYFFRSRTFFFFWHVHIRGGRGGFELVTSASWGVIPNRLSYPLKTFKSEDIIYSNRSAARERQLSREQKRVSWPKKKR